MTIMIKYASDDFKLKLENQKAEPRKARDMARAE